MESQRGCNAAFPFHYEETSRRPYQMQCLFSSRTARQEGKLISYFQVEIYLLESKANDNIISEANMDIMNYKQTAGRAQRTLCGFFVQNLYASGQSTTSTVYKERLFKD